jgi:hypothetical protein
MDNFSLMAGLNLAAISEETGDRQQALEYYEQVQKSKTALQHLRGGART